MQAGLAKIALEAEGITVELRQMELWSVAVEVLYSKGAAPSVWVPEQQAEQARKILHEHQEKLQSQTADTESDWQCPNCKEPNSSNFGSCWQCGESAPADNPEFDSTS